jgi:hypothetical protein
VSHTPGPWRIGKQGGSVVADIPIPEIGGSDCIEYYGGHLVAESITPSNAKLIAAAPDMLEALQFIVEQTSEPANAGHTLGAYQLGAGIDMARKAIAKAVA